MGNRLCNNIEIDHHNGYLTRYAKASRLHVQIGDYVQAGHHIADLECTGRCTRPHLHFECREIRYTSKSSNLFGNFALNHTIHD